MMIVWWLEKSGELDHVTGDGAGKFGNVLPNVDQEGIGFPAANQHNHVDWGPREDHGHGGAGADGVKADFVGSEPQDRGP